MNFRKKIPIIFLFILALIPIFRWAFIQPLSIRFFDFSSTMTSLGQITGLLGMMLFSLNLIISNRSQFFDKIFLGLHHFYNAHKWLGALSFSLLLFHPILLALKFVTISTREAAMFLLPGTSNAVDLGIYALLGMILLLGITFYLKIKYNIWRFSHKFMVIVFVLAILHTLLISSDVSRDMFLRFYILFFAFVGLFNGFFRAFLRKFFNKDTKFKVSSIKSLTGQVVEIKLSSFGEKMKFNPGQFVFIRFELPGMKEPHPFSISSGSGSDDFELVIKSFGDFTENLKYLQIGTVAQIEGPYGDFFKKNSNKKEIWIAGGVGITPFLSKARSLENIEHPIDLYYCVKEKNEAVLLNELNAITLTKNTFKVFPWFSKENGYISGDIILKNSGELKDVDIYICGPLPFMKLLQDQFIKLGVEKNNIIFEEFNFL